MAAPQSFAAAVTQVGLVPAPFADVSEHALGAVFGRIPELTMRAADELIVREVFGRLDTAAALPAVKLLMDTWQPDVVVREPAELSSYLVAEALGIPQVQVNIGVDAFIEKFGVLEGPLAEFGSRRGVAGLSDVPRWTLVPSSFDLPAMQVTAEPARFRDGSVVSVAGSTLPTWWQGDEPLVYVTFGSVAASLGLFPRFYATVLELLADVPVRVLLTLGEAGSPDLLGPVPPNAHVERWWPQAEIMPNVDLVVGHGGFGTTLAALATGVPQVVIPLFASDQFDNARRVAAVGAGIALEDPDVDDRLASEMIPAGPRAVEGLPRAVLQAISDSDLKTAATSVAAEIALLPEASDCVRTLEDLVV